MKVSSLLQLTFSRLLSELLLHNGNICVFILTLIYLRILHPYSASIHTQGVTQ